MRFIEGKERKEIVELLKYYGITKLPFLLIETSEGRIRGYAGSLSKEEIITLSRISRVEILGLYMFNRFEGGIRLSVDATHLLKEQIAKNIIELDENQAKEWMRGQDIILGEEDKRRLKEEKAGFKVIKFKEDFLGCGKLLNDRIVNYLPKSRREKK